MAVTREQHNYPCAECGCDNECTAVVEYTIYGGKQILYVETPDECSKCGMDVDEDDVLEYLVELLVYDQHDVFELWDDVEWEQ